MYLEWARGGRYSVERGITLGSNLAKMWEILRAKGRKELMPIPKTYPQCGALIEPKLIGNFGDKFVMWLKRKHLMRDNSWPRQSFYSLVWYHRYYCIDFLVAELIKTGESAAVP